MTASSLVQTGVADTALVIGADTFSTITDPADRTTRPIFGDGTGAVVLRVGPPGDLGALCGVGLGSGYHLITVRPDGPGPAYFRMSGAIVFAQAVERMCEAAVKTVDRAGCCRTSTSSSRTRPAAGSPRRARRTWGCHRTRSPTTSRRSATPSALATAARRGRLAPGHRVVLTGFGGGLA
jgi:3-oxoacyl-[acyl-carrier-protein] synthase-3